MGEGCGASRLWGHWNGRWGSWGGMGARGVHRRGQEGRQHLWEAQRRENGVCGRDWGQGASVGGKWAGQAGSMVRIGGVGVHEDLVG